MNLNTIPNFLKKRAFLTPNRTALVYEDQRLTFQDLYEEVYDISGKMTSVGMENGQFVGVLMKNHKDTVVIILALQLLGVKAVLLNNRLSEKEIFWQLQDSKVTLLITEQSFFSRIPSVFNKETEIKVITKEGLFKFSFEQPRIIDEVDMNEVCTIMYTSGTTGSPKGVLQTYGNHWWSAIGSALNLGLKEEDSWICAVPLFHISGYSIIMRSVIYGMKIVLYENFMENTIINDIQNERVAIMSVVTTMLKRIVDSLGKEELPKHFRCMLLGGGPAPLDLLKKCVDKQIPVYQTYGMTETASQIVTLSPEYSIKKLGSAGKALFPSMLKIVGEDRRELEAYKEGEIVVKGPNVTIGYLNHGNKSIENGWLYTGDLGYLDNEGFLFVLDRRSDLIISGGENIYPAEIEGVITSIANVKDAGVIGEKDEIWGEVPVVYIVLEEGTSLSEKELMNYCQQKLAKYKIPKKMYFIDEIPRNASKKILRRELRNLHNTGNLHNEN